MGSAGSVCMLCIYACVYICICIYNFCYTHPYIYIYIWVCVTKIIEQEVMNLMGEKGHGGAGVRRGRGGNYANTMCRDKIL